MRKGRLAHALLGLLAPASLGCIGQTGGNAVDFPVAAAGPASAISGQPLSCNSDGSWNITLTQATIHVGAVYLDQSQPVSGGQATSCYLTGTYVAQETSGLDVDLLSPNRQPFPAKAHGITNPPALVGQVWLTHGDINTIPDLVPVLQVAGTATQAGSVFPFSAALTIGANRQTSGGAVAGADPICKERIVTPIPAAVTIQPTGGLLLSIDPVVCSPTSTSASCRRVRRPAHTCSAIAPTRPITRSRAKTSTEICATPGRTRFRGTQTYEQRGRRENEKGR